MKKLLMVVFASLLLGCGSENFTIRPSTSYVDTVYILSGHTRSMLAMVDRASDFCRSKGRRLIIIDMTQAEDKTFLEAKFMCLAK